MSFSNYLDSVARPFEGLAPWILRLVLGVSFILHGLGKFPLPPEKMVAWFESMGILGPSIVAICYEGLPWFTGAAVISQGLPDIKILLFAALYAFGAFGIMTLNDFKALKGDTITGVNSLPVTMGPEKASKVACAVMTIPQLIVISLLYFFGEFIEAILIGLLVISQIILMRKLIKNPEKMAPWYNATGVTLYVIGMMIAAIALRGLI